MTDESSLLNADSDARTAALDVSRSFIVQAPAGSGKTELLIQRYLTLLACVQHPEEILAITFTRKAALEMQTRVNDALHEAKLGVRPGEEHRRRTVDLAAQALRRNDLRGWHLSESPRRMRIQTLDSFCASLAKSLPVSSGLGGALTTLADAEMRSLYRQAAAATLDWLLAGDQQSARAVARLLEHLDNHTGVYIEHLARMLETRDQWLGLTGSGPGKDTQAASDTRCRLEKHIQLYVSAQLEKLRQSIDTELRAELFPLLLYAADRFVHDGNGEHPLTLLCGTTDFPGCASDDLPAWRAIAGLLLKQDGDWRKSVNKNDGFPPKDQGEKKRLQDLLLELAGQDVLRSRLRRIRILPDPAYGDEQWEVLLALFSLLPLAVVELRRLFTERSITDHTEVAMAASVALGDAETPGDAAFSLDYAIQHILIDEMQDTSIGQHQLIEKLLDSWTPGDGKSLFCVGDPMQSIYRFRDAEVGRFLKIRNSGIGNVSPESLVLRRNFRSGANLVHWFNTVFSQVLPLQDDIADGAIRYSESVPVDSLSGKGEWRVHTLFNASSDEEADYGLDVVRHCLNAAGNTQSTAVLVRSRTQLPALLSRLRVAGIEYRAVEIDRLTDLPEIIDLMALTRAMCHEADRLAWLALLRGPWVGLTWTDLHRLVRNDSTSTIRELLGNAERLEELSADARIRVAKLLDLVDTYFVQRRSESLRERLEIAWYRLGGPALLCGREQLENAYRYFDMLEKIESSGTLTDAAELESRLDDERVSSIVDNPAALQVMTMHKAKGLEFDNVVLYALGRITRGRTKSVMSWTNMPTQDNEFGILLSPIGPRAELETDRLHQCIEVAESDKERLELDRLLYVACTRARESLHLIGSVSVNENQDSFRAPPESSLLGRIWPAVEREYTEAFARRENLFEGMSDKTAQFEAPSFRRFQPPFELPLAPDLPVRQKSYAAMDSDPGLEFYWVGMAARHAGTIVHRWLKRIADRSLTVSASSMGQLRQATHRMAVELGVAEVGVEDVCNRVEESLRGILQDPRGQWLLSGDGHAELPISGIWGDQSVSVIIDRVRIDQGVHWIVDYKTSSHEGGDLGQFLEQESVRYRPQLQKYATLYRRIVDAPVKTALYFPLLQEFRELDVD